MSNSVHRISISLLFIVLTIAFTTGATRAADYVQNGDFSGGTTNWTHTDVTGATTMGTDATNFGAASPSLQDVTGTGSRADFEWYNWQTISTPILAADTVLLSLWWRKETFVSAQAASSSIEVIIVKPGGATATIWSEATLPGVGTPLSANIVELDVSSFFDIDGTYDIRLYATMRTGRDNAAYMQVNWDDVVLDVRQPVVNNAPTLTGGTTSPTPASVNRIGTNTTTLSANFSDTDQPGVGAFTTTFRVREPDNATVVDVAVNSGNGQNGVTISDLGGGNYQASVDWDPGDAATLGAYDLYFEVSDGTDNAIDDYTNNLDELTVTSLSAPSFTPGITAASPITVNRIGTDSSRISATWSDADEQPIDSFWVTFSVREPDNTTEVIIADSILNGTGGLVVTDNGNGTYTAYIDWDPNGVQTLGLYDLRCRVFDGTTAVEDGYTSNPDELTVEEVIANNPPSIVAGATAVSVSPVNRVGANTTVISTDFTDSDQPGVGAFNVTFKIREPNNVTELTLVNNQPNGSGGLTITDNGGGSYTASYTYDPADVQALGLYDLYMEVSDGTDNAIDDYTSNLDELEIIQQTAPTVIAGATSVSVSPVNRIGANTTVISTDFTDTDQPGANAFTVTFKIREPDNTTEVTLVNAQTNGAGGLTITDNGGGSYTASYTYDPAEAQTTGLYDLYFEVSDGTDNAIDDYTNNLDELEINEVIANNAPTVVAGATTVSVSPVNRFGANSTVISTDFADSDQPGVGAFSVTFKIREPNNTTELTLVNNLSNGVGGLTITDNGGGSYTASYSYNPSDVQTLGLYDLYFEVSDGTDNAIDDYTNNLDELEINEVLANNAPTVTAGATQATVSPVARQGTVTTTLFASFNDIDQPGVGAFTITFKVRQPDNSTEDIIANALTNGSGGLTITDNGGGSYTAQIAWDPPVSQPLGLYDLYFEVNDGTDNAIDDYTNNLDELEVVDTPPNNAPTLADGNTAASPSSVNRIGTAQTTISATFSDIDQPGVAAFTATFKIREPNNTTELILVNAQTNGNGGLTITDNGGGSYTASYDYNPDDAQTLGLYDLYFEVSDGTDNVIDDYIDNPDELDIYEAVVNNPPSMLPGATTVSPVSVDRVGAATTTFSITFDDADDPGIGAFHVTFRALAPFAAENYLVADSLQNGVGGMTIVANGGGSYTASIAWNPPDNAILGNYDLYAAVSDGIEQGIDDFSNNLDELLLTNGGENIPPVVPGDNTVASPAGVERIGANPTTISATYSDGDTPGVGAFTVTFKLREPDNVAEIVLADNLGNGAGGVSISDDGGGIYTASIQWDPPDAQQLGLYDLYFHVSDGTDTSIDAYFNNLDELEVVDAISNKLPSLTAGNTTVVPDTLNRIGTQFTMLKATFYDADVPGFAAFTVTFKVRDQVSTEYTIVDAATHGLQGLRVQHLADSTYEASALWDAPDAQVTGPYDLFFSVQDNEAATATDDYANNTGELEVISAAIAGDGYLLRRNNDDGTCGGPANACHNLPLHNSQGCLTCHAPHETKNIYLIRDTIDTPNSGLQEVIFKTLGIGDPHNDPDPVKGDPNSGVMADSTDGVFTGVCEVCHTNTSHHRNDGVYASADSAVHNDAQDCTSCHPHDAAFSVSGGGESSGGSACSCHNSIFNPMNTSTSTYHHQLSANSPDYTISSKTCLMCHVDHDIFRPDLNTGIGQRAKNLRVDITTSVVQGNSSVLSNSDYIATGTGGICLSCHTTTQTKGYTQPDGTTETPIIAKTDFDASTQTHNYSVQSTFTTDGTAFNANCVKCHSDNRSKSFQNSTYGFSGHDSDYRRILSPLGIGTPADPLEEKFCFQCHSTINNPNAGTNQDYYGVKAMSDTALGIETAFGYTFGHPTTDFSGRHQPNEDSTDLADGNRHAECVDCHNPHAVQKGTHDGSSSLASNALKGTWGVKPTAWPDPPTPSNNANVFAAPTAYTRVEGATLEEWMICLKCHSNYTTLPSGNRNLAAEINPGYPSTHGITIAGTNSYCNTTTMNEPWASSGLTYCSDCHRSSDSADPAGPHGSNEEHLLVASIVSSDTDGTPLCNVCHKSTTYWNGSTTGSKYADHPASQSAHMLPYGCFACHMWDYASTPGLGVQTTAWAGGAPPANLLVHGQNKIWNFNEQDGATGTLDPVDNFCNGFLENIDHVGTGCWTATCKVHGSGTKPKDY